MRPVRLLLEGFGSYRAATEVDFSDVDFFVVTGATGAGKSTVIDGICFALYGRVPRWGRERAVGQAVSHGTSRCRVGLVFEAGGKRYAAVRSVSKGGAGADGYEAELHVVDEGVPAGASFDELAGSWADVPVVGADQVTRAVEELLGIGYEHFTQSVVVPQGRFADFLRAEPNRRHELLVELLAYGAYDKVGQLASQRAERAAGRLQAAQRERAELGGVTQEAEERASGRAAELTSFVADVDYRVKDLIRVTEQIGQREQQVEETRAQVSLLAGIVVPAHIPDLAGQIARAEQAVAARRQEAADAERALEEAERVRDNLPDRQAAEAFRRSYANRRLLGAQLEQQQWQLTAKLSVEKARASTVDELQDRVRQVRVWRDVATQKNPSYALAGQLQPGDQCPVCLQTVTEVPHHAVPPSMREARAMSEAAEAQLEAARKAHADAALDAAIARIKVEMTLQQLADEAVALGRAPDESEVGNVLASATEAEARLRGAREEARARRTQVQDAERDRAALADKEWSAWDDLRRARDSVAAIGRPAAERDLGAAWSALADWARGQHADRAEHLDWLEREVSGQRRSLAELTEALRQLLAGHGIEAADVMEAPAVVAAEKARAVSEFVVIARDRERADQLDDQILAGQEELQVTGDLAKLLRSASFERWLCSEALDSLVAEASGTLTELSGGRYQLDRDDENDLVVIDNSDAGARHPGRTLSGGETFQASLALALALPRQVAGLSAGLRNLQAVFLDEGFGTLDEQTLDTVAATLERLADDRNQIVGLITHVPALAERAGARFVVTRDGGGSSLRKERA
jgi:DNA repair protein SbcC/Rad50